MWRLLALCAGALAASLTPAACSGGSDAGPVPTATAPGATTAADSLAAVAARTREAGSARFSTAYRIDVGPTSGTVSGQGVVDGRRGAMTLDVSGLGGGPRAFVGGQSELIFDGLVLYLRLPPGLQRVLPGTAPWLRIDLAEIGEQEDVDFGYLAQASRGDPVQTLDFLAGASGDFEVVGTEAVRGVGTTHYRGTIDLVQVAEQAPEEARAAYRRLFELSGTSEIPADVWIDDEGRARRMRYVQPVLGQDGVTATTTTELYEFGAAADVALPPEGEFMEVAELIGGRG